MALVWLPAVLEALRAGLSNWYATSWSTLPAGAGQCITITRFNNFELEVALTDVGLDPDDFRACRSFDMESDPWSMWFYNQFPTCVGFSPDLSDSTCPTRQLVCAGSPTNLTIVGSYGTFQQQAAALLAAVDREEELVHPLCPGPIPTLPPTPRPTPDPDQAFTSGCTDENAMNYDALVDSDDGSCVYERTRTRTDFGVESRWWMNWRLPETNVAWINKYPGSITTVHPAHNIFVVEHSGGYRIDQWFRYEDHITPYFALNVDVMPVIDFDRADGESAIFSAFVLGDQQVLNALMATAQDLANTAVAWNFSGYVLDYEPYWEATVEHTEAYLSFAAMVKHAINAVDNRIDPGASGYSYRRVGICVSDWGIIDVTDDLQAEAYARSNMDFIMSMGYTYFLQEDGDAGFAEAKRRALRMKTRFPNQDVTIGISVESGNVKTDRWYVASDNEIDDYISFLHDIGIQALSVWGMWYYPDEDPEITRFANPMDQHFVSIGHHDEGVQCQPALLEDSVVSVSLAYSSEIQSVGHVNPLLLRKSTDEEWLYGCQRTCVSFSDSVTSLSCDSAERVCAGEDGATYGSQEEQLLAIAAAVANPDSLHPDCPLTQELCIPNFIGNYWMGLAESANIQAMYPLDSSLIGRIGNEWYYKCMRTFVGYGSSVGACDPDFTFCAGASGDTYGYGQSQIEALAEAVANGGKHPLGPQGCDDNKHLMRTP